MRRRVVGIASIYDHAELVPHFLAHYRALGVSDLLLVVREGGELEAVKRATRAIEFGRTFFEPAASFNDTNKVEAEERILIGEDLSPDDYVLHLDLDEFHQYPAPLSEVIDAMEKTGASAVSGIMIDRISVDGELKAVAAQPSIWTQFPIGVDLTGAILKGCTRKVMICCRRVRLMDGGRHDTIGAPHEGKPIAGDYLVHHFKWFEGINRRLEQRLSNDALIEPYRLECRRALDYFDRCAGRIDVSDVNLNPRFLTTPI